MHLNQWVSPESRFIDPDMWDACVDPDHTPLAPDRSRYLCVGVDVATKSDSSAVVGVYREPGDKVTLAFHRIWRPVGGPLDLNQTVVPYLKELNRKHLVFRFLFDPFQMASISDSLCREGLRMTEFPQTQPNLTEATSNLWELLGSRRLRLYPSPDLREHAMNAAAIETPRGLRLAKEKASRKIDGLAALSFAALGARQMPYTSRIGLYV